MPRRRGRWFHRRMRRTLVATLLAGVVLWWWKHRSQRQDFTQWRVGERHDEFMPEELALEAEDLTRISGIGPKVAALLHEASIATFAQLAATDVDELRRILRAAGIAMINPATWPQQARLAADEKRDELEEPRSP